MQRQINTPGLSTTMEQDIAILIADLSGYTALTETHGSLAAADMIDKYLEIVNDCLVGGSILHERVGDEVMIVSASPDDLVRTAVLLIKRCSEEHNFLQLHGGLHYGKVLKRNNNYFGTTINLASRMAASANKGTFWCTPEFVNAVTDRSAFAFRSRGMHIFKNVSEATEALELVIGNKNFFHIDPVCRMLIHKKETAVPHPGQNIFFCSPDCRDIYMHNVNNLVNSYTQYETRLL